MAAGTDFSPPFTVLEGGYNKENASITKDEIGENSEDLKKMTNGKYPRHLSVVRHRIGSATLTGVVDLDTVLGEEDEFLIIGSDGLWDVMSSQCAVATARMELMLHNDPERCSRGKHSNAVHAIIRQLLIVCFSPDPPRRIEIPQSRVRRSISMKGLNFLKGVLDSNS